MPSAKRIYLVEDEKEISDVIVMYLEREGYIVTPYYRGDEALDAIEDDPPDLAILDIMLPGVDGLDILRKIRDETNLPVIFLTSRRDEVDRVLGLELGADDYVPKPFSPRELVARVKSLFRRIEDYREQENDSDDPTGSDSRVSGRRFTLDLDGHRLVTRKSFVKLTSTEFTLLKLLMGRPGKIFTRRELLDRVWGDEFIGETRTVDVHVRNLRRKIQSAGASPDIIQSIRGVGYKFED